MVPTGGTCTGRVRGWPVWTVSPVGRGGRARGKGRGCWAGRRWCWMEHVLGQVALVRFDRRPWDLGGTCGVTVQGQGSDRAPDYALATLWLLGVLCLPCSTWGSVGNLTLCLCLCLLLHAHPGPQRTAAAPASSVPCSGGARSRGPSSWTPSGKHSGTWPGDANTDRTYRSAALNQAPSPAATRGLQLTDRLQSSMPRDAPYLCATSPKADTCNSFCVPAPLGSDADLGSLQWHARALPGPTHQFKQ